MLFRSLPTATADGARFAAARTSVRPACYSEPRTPPPGAGSAPGAAHLTCDRSLQTTCRHKSGGGVRFSALCQTAPATPAVADLEEAAVPHARITVPVDAHLHWVVRVPEVLAGAARASSAAQLAILGAELDALQVAMHEAARARVFMEAITRAVIGFLSEPPELPFIGEPFGGDDGTD